MAEKVEVYRLRLRRGTYGSNYPPDWVLYEKRETFFEDLLEAMIEAEASNYQNKDWRPLRSWVDWMLPKREQPGVKVVIGAEKLVDGNWVALKPRLLPPRLEFDGIEQE